MKKVFLFLLLAAFLTGCGAEPAWETVEDIIPVQPVAVAQQLYVSLPGEAVSGVFQEESGTEVYLCEDYTVIKQICESGDLEKTVKSLTGKETEQLEILRTTQENAERYDFVWTAAAEDGLQVGRACILDDGNYHYAVSVMAEESRAGELRETWQDMFASCRLLDPDIDLNTGS